MTTPVEINPTLLYKAASGGYQIPRSLRFRGSSNPYLSRTFTTPTNNKIYTISFWLKQGKVWDASAYTILNTGASGGYIQSTMVNNGDIGICDYSGGYTWGVSTVNVFRDPSAWYHFVFKIDTTQATAANRVRIYVNGNEATYSMVSYPSQNANTYFNSAIRHDIGHQLTNNSQNFDGYLTEFYLIDGQALTPSSFGQTDTTTGVWTPKKYTGTYGTNGFYLNFSDNSAATAAAIGKDSSGNGNNWTPNNISLTADVTYDSMIDTPTPYDDGGNGRGNYFVMLPMLGYTAYASATTFSNGNLTLSGSTHNSVGGLSSMPVPRTGKWYAECKLTASGGGDPPIGLFTMLNGQSTTSYAWFRANGAPAEYVGAVGAVNNTGASTFVVGDTVGIAIDNTGSGQIYFYTNGVLRAQGGAGCNTVDLFFHCQNNSPTFTQFDWNFGQRPFAYTPPSGFKALNTQNLPTPGIVKGSSYFNPVLYTGNGASRSITGVGFQPDFVWIKKRDTATNGSHELFDSVRGVTKYLNSNTQDIENTDVQTLTSFDTDGFSLGTNSFVNFNGNTFVGWNWKKGATPGFDIVAYTGTGANRTISHSLGVAPSLMIVKARNLSNKDWQVWHSALSGTQFMVLNTTAGVSTSATKWNSTVPTSSVFSLGGSNDVNGSGSNYIAYLFAEVPGFSKFGTYTGNGSANGPFVYCGFRPRYLLIKGIAGLGTQTNGYWVIVDTVRSTYNVIGNTLMANDSGSEPTWTYSAVVDILSNGFKPRINGDIVNNNGGSYIYAAFAENPFKYALAR